MQSSPQSRVARTQRQARIGAGALVVFALWTMVPRSAPAGTVAEQRARLPPPAQCSDPIVGIWKSHDYRGHRAIWEVFTLDIRRVEPGGTALTGTIRNQFWDGGPDDKEPGICKGIDHAIVSMDAKGSIDGDTIRFRGVGQWRLDERLCGSDFDYVLDEFTGAMELERQEFQTVANDGVVAINEPTVFRRIGCLDSDDPTAKRRPSVVVTPPSFYPPERDPPAAGCQGN